MTTITDIVRDRFGGVLHAGRHEPDGHACIFEAASIELGIDWTDDPRLLPSMQPVSPNLLSPTTYSIAPWTCGSRLPGRRRHHD